MRIGKAVGAAFTSRLLLDSVETCIMVTVGATLLALSILFAYFTQDSLSARHE